MAIAIPFNDREQRFLAFVYVEIFGGGSTEAMQKILGEQLEKARSLAPKIKDLASDETPYVELTAEEWRVMYDAVHAVIYGLGPHELSICTGNYLREACDINLKICTAVWGAYGGMKWMDLDPSRV